VPVVAGPEAAEAPGGAYRVEGGCVLREAGGREETLLRPAPPDTDPGPAGFDLLWFGLQERFVLRSGLLEVDDLFSRSWIPVSSGEVEGLLVRARRVDPGCLGELSVLPAEERPRIEVRRDLELLRAAWADPLEALAHRGGVVGVRAAGGVLELTLENGRSLQGRLRELEEGWEVTFTDEQVPWCRVWMCRDGTSVVHGAEPRGSLLNPALRTRHAFDLFSDLVRLSRGEP